MNNNIEIVVKPYKCDECDSEFCEYWLWCKGKNMEDNC